MSESETDATMDEWAQAMEEQAAVDADTPASEQVGDQAGAEHNPKRNGDTVEKAELQALEPDPQADTTQDVKLDVILDIPVTLSMEIGRTRINIRNLLQLTQGSVVELDRLAGEPMDVLVNGTLVAHGEVVVVNEKFGIRLTDVISPAERVKKLT